MWTMNITKEELEKRGFQYLLLSPPWMRRYTSPYVITYKEAGFYLNFYGEHDDDNYIDYFVPNCKTLDDLDNLIKLFKNGND